MKNYLVRFYNIHGFSLFGTSVIAKNPDQAIELAQLKIEGSMWQVSEIKIYSPITDVKIEVNRQEAD